MQKNDSYKFSYALSIATQLGFMTVASIGGFLALGLWLDVKLNSAPFFLLAGVVAGVTITIYEAFHLIKPLITTEKDDVC